MNNHNTAPERDEVLFAFHQASERPTAMQIVEWTKRYPQFADDIRAHAAVRLDRATGVGDITSEPDETMLARGRSRALNAIYQAQQNAALSKTAKPSWQQLLVGSGYTIPQLAKHIGIDRMVLAELAAGRMRLPLGTRLLDALTQVLHVAVDGLNDAVEQLLSNPRLGHAKADQQPLVRCRSYDDVIRASSMTDDLKKYWLAED